jgi:hypothetical protein
MAEEEEMQAKPRKKPMILEWSSNFY